MPEVSPKCQVCPEEGKFRCSGCNLVFYCSSKHQKDDWKAGHKSNCSTYIIRTGEDCGRYLEASRDLKAGTKIMTCQPLMIGPPLFTPKAICISCCLSDVTPKSISCSSCGFRLCSSKCKANHEECPNHVAECQALTKLNAQPDSKANYSQVLPLKILVSKDHSHEVHKKLMTLQSNRENLTKSSNWNDLDKNVIVPLSTIFNRADVEDVCGIILTNSFDIATPSPGTKSGSVLALYSNASMLNHSCLSNVRPVVQTREGELAMFATVAVRKGQELCFNYGNALDTFEERQSHLQEFKFFSCTCLWCQDPLELKTFLSSLRCLNCSGPCLDEGAKSASGSVDKWICTSCGQVMAKDTLQRAKGVMKQVKHKMTSGGNSEQVYKKLLTMAEEVCFNGHGLVIEVLLSLIKVMTRVEEPCLKEKYSYCQRILDCLNIMDPGMSLARGFTLFEMQGVHTYLANYQFERDQKKEPLVKAIMEAKTMLLEAKAIFALEPKHSVVHRSWAVAQESEDDLNEYIAMMEYL